MAKFGGGTWDVRGTRTIATLQSHRAPVRSLLVHNGGLWSGSTDGTVRNWEIGQYVGAPAPSPLGQSGLVLEEFIATGARPFGADAHSMVSP